MNPLLHSARREASVVGLAALTATSWSVWYCWRFGYGRDPRDIKLIAGVPDWVLWGIVIPWGVCVLFSTWFSLCYMQDAELEADAEDPPGSGATDD